MLSYTPHLEKGKYIVFKNIAEQEFNEA